MKYFYSTIKENRKVRWFAVATLFLLGNIDLAYSQVRVPFTIRTSSATPLQKNFSITGDFSFIGNTNLTLVNYDSNVNNNNNSVQYIDVDADPSTWNSSSADLGYSHENGSIDSCTEIRYAGLYWTGRSTSDGATNSPNEFSVTKNINGAPVIKSFNKKKIRFKGPTSSDYAEFYAEENAIYYPNTSDAFIYSAYTEVTDYVRQNGVGTYFAADIALVEGNGGGTGYSGGWGLVVIYENSKMKHRDITLFDGHAFVLNSSSNGYNLEVNGFNTLQSGNVGVKLGIMASEGDVGLNGDYFQIQKNSDLGFMNLHHSLNSENNFFNSSNTNSSRNPALSNNTGIDIATFSLPNENNLVIGNNQTSTNFRYGTVGDTYAIFAIALAVDSYLPKVENTISVADINGIPYASNMTVLPGQEVNFDIAIRNLENESISNFQMVIPMPYNASYIEGSAQGLLTSNPLISNSANIHFDATIGTYGSLVWNYGTLPVSSDPSLVIANLRFKIGATQNCNLLKNNNCNHTIFIDGFSKGTGTISGATFEACPFILGKTTPENCNGKSIKGPLAINIDATNFILSSCAEAPILNLTFCDELNSVSISEIASNFPPGCLFYNAYPVTESSISFSGSASLPLIAGSSVSYFAIPSDSENDCVFPFLLTKCPEIITTQIIAQNNTFEFECSSTGIIGNVLSNDTFNGNICQANDVDISVVNCSNENIVLNNQTGDISIGGDLSSGNYTLQYKISAKGNPTSFAIATVSIAIVDSTPPAQPLLLDLISYCAINATIPSTTDNCSGIVNGYTNDPLYYSEPGAYIIHWSFSDDSNNTSTTEQNVIIKSNEDSLPGYGYVDCNLDNDESLNIDLNTFLPEGTNRNGTWISTNDAPNLSGSVFSPYQAITGNYDFTYQYNEADCNQIAHVTIEVNNDCLVAPACNLMVHNSFSPNNDGINEVFFIENIDQINCFPTNSVEIFNRWGVLVFKTNQYDNLNRVFRGISEGRVTLNASEQLPTGTYYYIIKYADEKFTSKEQVGYVYLVM